MLRPPSAGSALGRGVTSLFNTAIGDPLRGAWDFATLVGREGAPAAAGRLVTGLTDASITRGKAAITAAKAGQAGEMLYQGATAFPLVGPMVGGVVDQARSGDVAGAVGSAAGIAAPWAGAKALRVVRPSGRPPHPVGPLTAGEASGRPVLRAAEAVSERLVPSLDRWQRLRRTQQEAITTAGDDAVARILNPSKSAFVANTPSSATDIGTRVHTERKALQAQTEVIATQMYDQIDQYTRTHTVRVPKVTSTTTQVPSALVSPSTYLGTNPALPPTPVTTTTRTLVKTQVGGVMVNTDALKRVAIPLLRRIKDEAQIVNPQNLAPTADMLATMVKMPKYVPFRAMQDARSSLGNVVRRNTDLMPGKATGLAKKLEQEVDAAMMDAARTSHVPGLEEMVRDANAVWKHAKQTHNDAFVQAVANASPEVVPELIRGADVADILTLRSTLPRRTFDEVRAHLLREVLNKSTTPAPPSSYTAGVTNVLQGSPGGPSTVFSAQKLRTQLVALGPAKTNLLFGPRAMQTLDEIGGYADRITKRAGSGQGIPSLMLFGVNAMMLAPIFHPLGISFGSTTSAIGTIGSTYVLGRILTNPGGLVATRNALAGLSTGNRPLWLASAAQLTAMLKDQQQQTPALPPTMTPPMQVVPPRTPTSPPGR